MPIGRTSPAEQAYFFAGVGCHVPLLAVAVQDRDSRATAHQDIDEIESGQQQAWHDHGDEQDRRWRNVCREAVEDETRCSAGSWCRGTRRRRLCRSPGSCGNRGAAFAGGQRGRSRMISPPIMPVVAAMKTAATKRHHGDAARKPAGPHADGVIEVARHPRSVHDRRHQQEHGHGQAGRRH